MIGTEQSTACDGICEHSWQFLALFWQYGMEKALLVFYSIGFANFILKVEKILMSVSPVSLCNGKLYGFTYLEFIEIELML